MKKNRESKKETVENTAHTTLNTLIINNLYKNSTIHDLHGEGWQKTHQNASLFPIFIFFAFSPLKKCVK